jgi:hypothetical protein
MEQKTIYDNPKTYTIAWFNHYLKKKATFANAQGWQEHVYDECYNILGSVIPKQCQEKCHPNPFTIVLVSVEQQKGRVNSILEQTLLCCCKQLKLPIYTVHPVTWKKAVNLQCAGSNKKNKSLVVEFTKPAMEEYFGVQEETARIHDLCDAFQIRKAGYIHHLNTSNTMLQE